MPDTRTVLITGATDGLGLATAGRLAAEGHRLILHGRDDARLAAAAARVRAAGGDDPATVRADLSSLAESARLADEVRRLTGDRLDVLISNAGIGSGEPDGRDRRESADGHELRFAVNYLAAADLTLRLLPALAHPGARVVLVASAGQLPLDFDDVMLERDYSGTQAYRQSKLALVTFGRALAARLDGTPTVTSVHPGTYMPTKIVTTPGTTPIDTLESGVDAVVRLAVDPALDGVTGVYVDRLAEATPHEQALDPDARRRLWDLTLELTGAPAPA